MSSWRKFLFSLFVRQEISQNAFPSLESRPSEINMLPFEILNPVFFLVVHHKVAVINVFLAF